jgi:putative chitinase
MDWISVLHEIAPRGNPTILKGVADAMPTVIKRADLSSHLRLAHFLGQCAEESDGFHTTREYGGEAYLRSKPYYPYFGRGIIQTTWKANYVAAGKFFAVDFVSHPSLLETFPYAAYSAGFYWGTHPRCNQGADADDCRMVTHAVNGGENGLSVRLAFTRAAKVALARHGA